MSKWSPTGRAEKPKSPLQVLQAEASGLGVEAICGHCIHLCPGELETLSAVGDCLKHMAAQSAFGVCTDWQPESLS